MKKDRIERNLLFPSREFRDRVRSAASERGFRSEQAFILTACEHELRQGDNTEATAQLEARIPATLANMAKEVQSLFTLVHTQVALANSLLQYVLTCVVEPPEEVLPAARARARLRYTKILRLAAQEVATRNKATLEEVLTAGKQQSGKIRETSFIPRVEAHVRALYISCGRDRCDSATEGPSKDAGAACGNS
jgi:hypothetical protein